eukprot:Skav219879  [mRNA]  locus=scaffold777:321701:322871:- [translate_table: standard]
MRYVVNCAVPVTKLPATNGTGTVTTPKNSKLMSIMHQHVLEVMELVLSSRRCSFGRHRGREEKGQINFQAVRAHSANSFVD